MNQNIIKVSVNIDAKLFRNFALFDAFRIKKRWKLPALFALILTVSALLCFSRSGTADQAVFMGCLLLAIALGIPLVWFVYFLNSINAQIRRFGLKKKQPAYTVTLSEASDGIQVETKNGETLRYNWRDIYGAYRGKNCTYLYVQSNRAWLLPDEDAADSAGALEELLRRLIS